MASLRATGVFHTTVYLPTFCRTVRYLPFPVSSSSVQVAPRCLVVKTVDNKHRILNK